MTDEIWEKRQKIFQKAKLKHVECSVPPDAGARLSLVCLRVKGNQKCFQFTVFDFASESNNLFRDSNYDSGSMSDFGFAFMKDSEKRAIQYSTHNVLLQLSAWPRISNAVTLEVKCFPIITHVC